MKIDREDFDRKAQHIVDTVVKPQVDKYERVKEIEEAAANLADPNLCKTDNWIAGAKWQQERMYSEEEVHNIITSYKNNKPKVFLKVFYNEWFEQFKKK